MFTGIIEHLTKVLKVEPDKDNIHFTFSNPFKNEIKIDQSIAHNGVCLTVVQLSDLSYTVTAIKETLLKSNLGLLKVGDEVNVERCMTFNGRIDGHIVQGHVDMVGEIIEIKEENGSWEFSIQHPQTPELITVPKGSICVNGVSLTVVQSHANKFSVAIIPYTYEHTTFKHFKLGSKVNLEFDILGKYVALYMKNLK